MNYVCPACFETECKGAACLDGKGCPLVEREVASLRRASGLLDTIAIAAMQALITAQVQDAPRWAVAEWAYDYAEAMLVERRRRLTDGSYK